MQTWRCPNGVAESSRSSSVGRVKWLAELHSSYIRRDLANGRRVNATGLRWPFRYLGTYDDIHLRRNKIMKSITYCF